MLKRWWRRLTSISDKPSAGRAEIYSGAGQAPDRSFALSSLNANVRASCTGPDVGVRSLLPCVPDLKVQFDHQTAWACGHSTSLYDLIPSASGARAGDPIADCYALIAYDHHTVLVVADGVNWGEPAKRAARSAVLGAVAHLHKHLPELGAPGQPQPDSNHVFRHLKDALEPAQKLIISQCGTMTTLVVTVVARLAAPVKRSTLRPASSPTTTSPCYHWAAMTITVGDSSAFVYRQEEDVVEDLTAGVHATAYRDPRWTPGALGYAAGEEPDLSNLTCSLTLLNNGDLVFLTSDGVADNFDPFMLKMARQAIDAPQWSVAESAGSGEDDEPAHSQGPQLPIFDSQQSHAKKMELITEVVQRKRQAQAQAHHGGGGPRPGPLPALQAEALVDGLLQHVTQKTEAQRKWAERKHVAKEHERTQRRSLSREMPSLCTDLRTGSQRDVMPPGKMDHATIAAHLVGGQALPS